jgi:Domain of unknown function (DUF397)
MLKENWRKSSYSGDSGNGSCVEVAFGVDAVGVRDSKNADGPRLAFAPECWRAFARRTPLHDHRQNG